MNKILYEQLKKTSIPLEFDEDTKKLFIPKMIKFSSGLVKAGEIYRIKLSKSITNPDQNSTLASNWNNGIIPKHDEYIVEIISKMADMIKVNGVAVEDQSDNFYGWLPENSFEIIEKK